MGYYKKNGEKIFEYENVPYSEKKLFTAAINDICTSDAIKGIEIGVLDGETSGFLLSINSKIFLTGIDPIVPDSMETSLIGSLEKISNNTRVNASRFLFIHDYSFNVYDRFDNHDYDFIFIDGSHHYGDVKKDYELYFSKINTGGLIFFHDSRMNRGGANFHIGSSKFVDELIINDLRIELIGEAFSLTCFIKK